MRPTLDEFLQPDPACFEAVVEDLRDLRHMAARLGLPETSSAIGDALRVARAEGPDRLPSRGVIVSWTIGPVREQTEE